ncbi:hypothetical protein F5146DRAFT_159099 [Armillaria mellea]|nr:hypothetical protein F5146DRAFT_159099 [Armillaria mellea]
MELKLERLLRYHPRMAASWSLSMTIPDIDSSKLTIGILSNGCLLRDREIRSLIPSTLFHDISYSKSRKRLPPRCWYHLMISTKHVFSPLDPDNDDHANMFPLLLCDDILLYWSDPSSKSRRPDYYSEFDSSLLQFGDAFLYFLDKIYDLVLPMLSKFVTDPSLCEPSLPLSLRVSVAAIKFLLHRLSFPERSHIIIRESATTVEWIRDRTFSLQEATAIMMVLYDILDVALRLDSYWVRLSVDTILTYPSLTTIAPSARSLRGLRSMVDFMKIHWDEVYPWSNTACGVLADLLVMRVPIAFTGFLEGQCLQFLGNHTFHEASVPMVSAYIAGISAMQHGSDGVTHVDYLHNPQNLFTVCSILATHGFRNIDRTAIRRDITRLVQLRPRDATWDECRRKLRGLVQGDNWDFFSEQRVWSETNREVQPLQLSEIEVVKDNIRYGIHVLDNFFDGGGNTGMAPLDRFLGWCLDRRKSEDKPEQNQQV